MDAQQIGRMLMVFGAMLLAVGAVLYFGGRLLPLGHLPGDFHFESGNASFHFPMMTCILVSVILSVLANLFFRR